MSAIELGRVVVWEAVEALVDRQDMEEALRKHATGEWRSLSEAAKNFYRHFQHDYYMSEHFDRNGHRFLIVTATEDGELQTHIAPGYAIDFQDPNWRDRKGPWFAR